jgi:integrase
MSEVFEKSTGQPIHFKSVEEWFTAWLESKKGSIVDASFIKYKSCVTDWLKFLESRKTVALGSITPADVVKFRDFLKEGGRSSKTVNDVLSKIIGSAFNDAKRLGYVTVNPVDGVKRLIDKRGLAKREAFSQEEVLKLLDKAEGDWKGMILGGFTTGLRLRDLADMTWGSINFEKGLIKITAQKTGFDHTLPLHKDFKVWLESRPRGIGKASVFPSLAGIVSGGRSGLSQQFKGIMEKAGVIGAVIREGKGAGRTTSTLSFHSLRHAMISQMAGAGIGADLRMRLSGHTTERVHKVYTHFEIEQMRGAIESISLFGGGRK